MQAGHGWHVSGLLRIDEVADATGFRAPEGEYETIGGLVLQELGHIPDEGEAVELTAFDPDDTAGGPGALAGDGGAHGRPAHRPARADPEARRAGDAGTQRRTTDG